MRGREPVAMMTTVARHRDLRAVDLAHRELARRAVDGAAVRRDEARAPAQQRDVVALELRRHVGVVRGDGRADAVEQRLQRFVHEVHVAHALAQRMLAQTLARNGAGMHARAADPPVALDDRHAFAGFRGLDGRLLARGPRADHHYIEMPAGACGGIHPKLSAVA